MTFPQVLLTVVLVDVALVIILMVLSIIVARRRPKPKPTPSSADRLVLQIRAALDSGKLDAAVERVNRRNQTRRSA